MGCDGGTIPKRHELVKGPKKVEKVGHFPPSVEIFWFGGNSCHWVANASTLIWCWQQESWPVNYILDVYNIVEGLLVLFLFEIDKEKTFSNCSNYHVCSNHVLLGG